LESKAFRLFSLVLETASFFMAGYLTLATYLHDLQSVVL